MFVAKRGRVKARPDSAPQQRLAARLMAVRVPTPRFRTAMAVLLVVAGCAASVPPKPTGALPVAEATEPPPTTPSATAPTSSPTPAPADPTPAPPADLRRTTTFEGDGIEITAALEVNPLRAGVPTWATTEIRNTGRTNLLWQHDGCAIAVRLQGTMNDAPWMAGQTQAGLAAEFKRLALKEYGAADGQGLIDFVPEHLVGKHRITCADAAFVDEIAPGASITLRALWDGTASRGLGLPPGGPVQLHATAREYWHRGDGPRKRRDSVITFDFPSWVLDGGDPALLDPPEILDAAVADEEFMREIAARPLRMDHIPILRLDPQAGVWEVGVLGSDDRALHVALVDPATGEVLDVVTRPQDPG